MLFECILQKYWADNVFPTLKLRLNSGLGLLLLMLFAVISFASSPALATLVAIPTLQSHVTDLTGTLSQDEQSSLETRLVHFETQKGSQIAVLLIPTTQPEEIEQFSIRVVDAWKLGRKKVDDGVLVIVAKNDHKVRIEVGRGLEGAIPDLYAKRIIQENITPKFKQGDFAGGLNDGLDSLIKLVNGEPLPAPTARSATNVDLNNILPLLLFGTLFLATFLRMIFGKYVGGIINGGIIGALVWFFGLGVLIALVVAVLAFFFTLMTGSGRGYSSGYPGGFGGSGGGSTWSGGGGGFGGGGASGSW